MFKLRSKSLKRKIPLFLGIFLVLSFSQLSFSLTVKVNYFGQKERLSFKEKDNDRLPQGSVFSDDKKKVLDPDKFLIFVKKIKSLLESDPERFSSKDDDLIQKFSKLPDGYRKSMLVAVYDDKGRMYQPFLNHSSIDKDKLDRLASLAFGDDYRKFFAHKTLTLYTMGTGSNYYFDSRTSEEIQDNEILMGLSEGDLDLEIKPSPYKNFSGEITATAARYTEGVPLVNYYAIDGPGSGNFRFQQSLLYFERDKLHNTSDGGIKGSGLYQNVKNASFLVQARLGILEKNDFDGLAEAAYSMNPYLAVQVFVINELSKKEEFKIDKLNALGWSRGGVATILISNELALSKKITRDQLDMKIVAIDPVPGPFIMTGANLVADFFRYSDTFDEKIQVLPPLVSHYLGFYANDETSAFFDAVLPRAVEPDKTKVEVYHFPGHHAIVAGSNNASRSSSDEEEQEEFLQSVPNLIRQKTIDFLKKSGRTRFDEEGPFPSFAEEEKVEQYETITQNKERFLLMGKGDLYTGFLGTEALKAMKYGFLKPFHHKGRSHYTQKSIPRYLLQKNQKYYMSTYQEFFMRFPEVFVNSDHEDIVEEFLVNKSRISFDTDDEDELASEVGASSSDSLYFENKTDQDLHIYLGKSYLRVKEGSNKRYRFVRSQESEELDLKVFAQITEDVSHIDRKPLYLSARLDLDSAETLIIRIEDEDSSDEHHYHITSAGFEAIYPQKVKKGRYAAKIAKILKPIKIDKKPVHKRKLVKKKLPSDVATYLRAEGYQFDPEMTEIAVGIAGYIYKVKDAYGKGWAVKVARKGYLEERLFEEAVRFWEKVNQSPFKDLSVQTKVIQEGDTQTFLLKEWLGTSSLFSMLMSFDFKSDMVQKIRDFFDGMSEVEDEFLSDLQGENIFYTETSKKFVFLDPNKFAPSYINSALDYYLESRAHWMKEVKSTDRFRAIAVSQTKDALLSYLKKRAIKSLDEEGDRTLFDILSDQKVFSLKSDEDYVLIGSRESKGSSFFSWTKDDEKASSFVLIRDPIKRHYCLAYVDKENKHVQYMGMEDQGDRGFSLSFKDTCEAPQFLHMIKSKNKDSDSFHLVHLIDDKDSDKKRVVSLERSDEGLKAKESFIKDFSTSSLRENLSENRFQFELMAH